MNNKKHKDKKDKDKKDKDKKDKDKKDKDKKDKDKKDKKNIKIPILRTEEERKQESRTIIDKLTELQLTIAYDPIKQLFIILQDYKKNGGRININIPFPMISKRIKGFLADTVNEECWVKLEHENF
jgi:hypothetical protein